jgi:hypothetical protein
MLTLTRAAGGYLTRLLDEAHAPDGTALRIVKDEEHLRPRLDTPKPGDQVFDHAGRKVLLLDPSVSSMLAASQLDVERTARGEKLIIVH